MMGAMQRWLLILMGMLGEAVGGAVWAETATRASLFLSAAQVRPGETVWAGVQLRMAPGWHTYWSNPGESGMATALDWKLPRGLTAGAIQWPAPERYVASGMTTYVHHDEAVLLVPLSIAADHPTGEVAVDVEVSWLECQETCVPGSTNLQGSFRVAGETVPAPNAERFAAWRGRIPVPEPRLGVVATWSGSSAAKTASLVVEGVAAGGFVPEDFAPYPAEDYELDPAVQVLEAESGRFKLSKTVKWSGTAAPERIAGVLIPAGRSEGGKKAYEVVLEPGRGAVPPRSDTEGAVGGGGSSRGTAPGAGGRSLMGMLLLAFLGGMILNVMPCVLPVIALKILGFVQQSRENPAGVRRLGMMYGLGVWVSFLVMAAVVIGVQQAGGAASWGMQMQSAWFRVALLIVVTLVTLNLFGVFEVSLGGRAMGAASQWAAREGSAGAFFNGVLATALGTSCTAPFLAVAVGFAFTQTTGIILLVFSATAFGLAFPYVLLSAQPRWLRFLPRPGPWMGRFKVLMGFPMACTAVWLLDLAAPSYGDGGFLWLGLFVMVLSLIAWVWGEYVQRGTARAGWSMALCVVLAAVAYGGILEGRLQWRTPRTTVSAGDVIQDVPGGIAWHRWSPEAVDRERQNGRSVLVDFTAKWCPNCLWNKKFAIDVAEVRERMKRDGTVAFRADYTDRDPRITEELRRHGRAGVPLVLVFPADLNRAPQVLPTALTPAIVLEALAQAAGE